MKDLAMKAQEAQKPPAVPEAPEEGTTSMNMRVKLGILILAIFWLGIVAASWAEAAETTPNRSPAASSSPPTASDDDEYSFNWLDPDKKIYVLQNRRYTKAGHALISVMGGLGLSNSYRNTLIVEPRLAFYFTEAWGVEFFLTNNFNHPNNTVDALARSTATTLAVVREIQTELGAMIHYVPWYAKINVFNKILYFDWYLSAGGGSVHSILTDSGSSTTGPAGAVALDQTSPAFFLATGQEFHLSEQFVFRLDLTGGFYNARIDTKPDEARTWYSNFNFGVGLGLRL